MRRLRSLFPALAVLAVCVLLRATAHAQEAPYGGTPWALPGTVQSENFDTGGDNVAYYTSDNINHGGQYRTSEGVSIETTTDTGGGYDVGWTAPGEWINYTVNVGSTGSYVFNVRVANTGAGGAFHINVDGANLTGSISVPNTGGWQTWTTVSSPAVQLSAGQHIVQFYMDTNASSGAVGNFNWFSAVMQNNGEAPYGGTPWALPGTVQSENFDTGGDNVAYYTSDNTNHGGQYRTSEGVSIETTTDTGGGYDVGWTAPGEWINYTVNVTAAGDYLFNVRVANPGDGGSFHINVDGADVTGSMAIPNTGGWQSWTTITSNPVQLSAGQHVVQFYMDANSSSGAAGNFNWFSVSASTNSSEAPYGGTPWALPGTVQAENFDTGGDNVAYYTSDNTNHGGQYRPNEGVSIETTSDTGGGYDVGWTAPGEWINYTVNVTASGTYYFNARVANPGAGGAFHINLDGTDVTGSLSIPNTGGWQTWTTISSGAVQLAAGQHIVQLYMDTNASSGAVGNFNWFSVSSSSGSGGGGGGGTGSVIFSQYKDISVNANWNTGQQQTAVTGTVQPVVNVMPNTTETWAFATGSCGSENWAGIPVSQEVTNVQDFVNAGKKYIISTGGAAGSFSCDAGGAAFVSFIQTYYSANMLGVDFDIESGQSQSLVDNLINDVIYAQNNGYGNLRYSFTLATLGGSANPALGSEGIMVVNEIKNLGLSGNYTINLMTMDYGTTNSSNCVVVNGACEMGQSAVQAAVDLNQQFGIPYSHIEITPMIGGNDTQGEVFTLSDVDTVSNFVKQNGLAGVHFWSLDRDDDCTQTSASSTCNSYGQAGTFGFTNQFDTDLGL